MVSRVHVKGLFGLFEHVIALTNDAHITVIHGPNGFGKSVLLRLIDASFNGDYDYLRDTPFEELIFTLDDGSHLKIARTVKAADRRSKERVDVHITLERGNDDVLQYKPSSRVKSDPGVLFVGWTERTERPDPEPAWLASVKSAFDVRLIATDRLTISTTRPDPDTTAFGMSKTVRTPAVLEYANELAVDIKSALAQYAELSQRLDRTFPQRLVSSAETKTLEPDDLNKRLAALEQKRKRLTAAGLLEREEAEKQFGASLQGSQANERTRSVLTIYVTDTEQKLSIFDEFLAKIELFKELLDAKFSFKQIVINKDLGFLFWVPVTQKALQADQLSSGEQHEIVLLYRLLFRTTKRTLVLLDEPELSLHLIWQERFLPDLERIAKLSPIDVLIATHSAEIISERRDLMVALSAPPSDGT